jgi:thiol-disulfide isomerase/thioredoxin
MKPTYRNTRPVGTSLPPPALPSNALRNFLIGFVLIFGAFSTYAYEQNPEGSRKVVNDSRDLVVSLLPGQKGTPETEIVTGASIGSSAPATSSTPAPTPAPPPPPVSNTVAVAPASQPAAAPATSTEPPPPTADSFPTQPNWTWTTLDGKTYQDVVIIRLDPDIVSINHSTGVAHIPINLLSDDVKKQLHYDPAAAAAAASQITRMLDGKLVGANGAAVSAPGSDVKYYALYYSAGWCPPCHAFSPRLVAWYNKFKPTHPNFELIFVSDDHSETAQFGYMKEMAMTWPAVKYSELAHNGTGIEKFAGPAIPDLVLVDSDGKVLSDSFNGTAYIGPETVVEDINRLVGGMSPVPLVRATPPALPPIRSAVAISDTAWR